VSAVVETAAAVSAAVVAARMVVAWKSVAQSANAERAISLFAFWNTGIGKCPFEVTN
jgi:hypothetical protein